MPSLNEFYIPEPCTQRWENMSPEGEGRFCQSCKKVIHDFSDGDEQKFREVWKQQNGSICGRLPASRISISVLPILRHSRAQRMKRVLVAAVALLGLKGLWGKGILPVPPAGYFRVTEPTVQADSVIRLSGTVREVVVGEGQPLERAIIFIEADSQLLAATYSDEEGRFFLDIRPDQIVGDHFNLYVSHLGRNFVAENLDWRTQHFQIDLESLDLIDQVSITADRFIAGKVVVGLFLPIHKDIIVVNMKNRTGFPQGYDLNDWLYMNHSEIKQGMKD